MTSPFENRIQHHKNEIKILESEKSNLVFRLDEIGIEIEYHMNVIKNIESQMK